MFGVTSFFPKSATPALVIVPFRVTLVLPEVLVAGVAQLAVPFGDQRHPREQDVVGLPATGGPLNTSVQPLKFDAGAVDARPLTARRRQVGVTGPRRRPGRSASHACAIVVEPRRCAVHLGIPVGLIVPSLSYSTVTVFANPPWALSPGLVYLVCHVREQADRACDVFLGRRRGNRSATEDVLPVAGVGFGGTQLAAAAPPVRANNPTPKTPASENECGPVLARISNLLLVRAASAP